MYYFAYGSNMSSRRLLARVPSAKSLGVAFLHGYEMNFSKPSHDGSAKCTIEPDPHASTLGVIFKLPADQRYTLDRIEGQNFGYEVCDIQITTQSGETVQAFTYIGTDLDKQLKPYSWYKHHVIAGALEHGITTQYIDKIRSIEAIDDPDPERHQYEMSIYDEL